MATPRPVRASGYVSWSGSCGRPCDKLRRRCLVGFHPATLEAPGVVEREVHAPGIMTATLALPFQMIKLRAAVDHADPPGRLRLAAEIDILEIADDKALVEAADAACDIGAHHEAGAGDRLDLVDRIGLGREASLA